MQTNGQQKKPNSTPAVNPFAKAMAEVGSGSEKDNPTNDSGTFSEALAKAGGSLGDNFSQEQLLKQRQEMEKEQERAALHKKQHDKINPDDQHEVFAAKAKQDKEEELLIVQQLQLLAQQKQMPAVEQPKVLDAPVINTGERGATANGLIGFARKTIERFTVQNWEGTFKTKQKKRKGPQGPGAQTKAIQDTFHHERATGAVGA